MIVQSAERCRREREQPPARKGKGGPGAMQCGGRIIVRLHRREVSVEMPVAPIAPRKKKRARRLPLCPFVSD
jgi:hypothetical protein